MNYVHCDQRDWEKRKKGKKSLIIYMMKYQQEIDTATQLCRSNLFAQKDSADC